MGSGAAPSEPAQAGDSNRQPLDHGAPRANDPASARPIAAAARHSTTHSSGLVHPVAPATRHSTPHFPRQLPPITRGPRQARLWPGEVESKKQTLPQPANPSLCPPDSPQTFSQRSTSGRFPPQLPIPLPAANPPLSPAPNPAPIPNPASRSASRSNPQSDSRFSATPFPQAPQFADTTSRMIARRFFPLDIQLERGAG